MNEKCLYCQSVLEGRVDKLYCSSYCKSSYHYQKNKNNNQTRFKTVDNQLKRNRSVLKHFHKVGKTTLKKEELLKKGFDPNYFTNYWKNNKNDVYLFCYEYGFLSIGATNNKKYLIIDWQNYMIK